MSRGSARVAFSDSSSSDLWPLSPSAHQCWCLGVSLSCGGLWGPLPGWRAQRAPGGADPASASCHGCVFCPFQSPSEIGSLDPGVLAFLTLRGPRARAVQEKMERVVLVAPLGPSPWPESSHCASKGETATPGRGHVCSCTDIVPSLGEGIFSYPCPPTGAPEHTLLCQLLSPAPSPSLEVQPPGSLSQVPGGAQLPL